MTLDTALSTSEILLGLAYLQHSLEHLRSKGFEYVLFLVRFVLSVLLILSFATPLVLSMLWGVSAATLYRFRGPYNGGADRMSLLVLSCLCVAELSTNQHYKEWIMAYLALQLILSYFVSGWVKLVNSDWRNGRALCDVFLFSVYPSSLGIRAWALHPLFVTALSWGVIGFELLFPIALITKTSSMIMLCIAIIFHFCNACLFGLNRFVWSWIAAYPALLWFQQFLEINFA